jgi:hypothetical protein
LATLGWSVKRGAVDEHAELDDPLDPVERAERRLHLGEQHDPAAPRGARCRVEVDVLAQPAFDQAAVLGEADLARRCGAGRWCSTAGHSRDGRGGLGKGDAEFGEALVDAHGGAWPQAPRAPVNPRA